MQPALNIDEVALKYSDAEVRIHVGDSVCYNHKVWPLGWHAHRGDPPQLLTRLPFRCTDYARARPDDHENCEYTRGQ